jgi:hypothetical protein
MNTCSQIEVLPVMKAMPAGHVVALAGDVMTPALTRAMAVPSSKEGRMIP